MVVAGREQSGLTLGELQAFVQYAPEEARSAFADLLPGQLERLTPEARSRLWREFLAPYWADRRTNMPVALAPDELREMVSWVRALPEDCKEVVTALRASPRHRLKHADGVVWKWKDDSAWVAAHPAATAGVISFLAERESINSWMADAALDVLEAALGAGAPRDIVLEAAEHLVSVSPQRAAGFVARLRAEG
jgi:hypothetical protein